MSDFLPKKCFYREFYCTSLFKRNLQLKHTELLLRFTVILFCHKQHEDICFDAAKRVLILLTNTSFSADHKKILVTKIYDSLGLV